MSLLIESIKVLDGNFFNLFYHEQRMIRSLKLVCGVEEDIHLEKFLKALDIPKKGLFKCRITYDETMKEVEFLHYKPRVIRKLRIVEHDRISYEFKYKNRSKIDKLAAKRKECDDIIIIRKGQVTDSSVANIVFRKGKHWVTPWSALLRGTMRQNLIEHNKIREEEIQVKDIQSFDACKLINAMVGFESPEIDVSRIIYNQDQ